MEENTVNEPQEQAAEAEEVEAPDWEAKYREAVAQSRKWEARAKKSLAAEDEVEKVKQTYREELDKLVEQHSAELEEIRGRAERAEARASELQALEDRRHAIEEISTTTGVPPEMLEYCDSPAQMEAFAEDYLKTNSANKVHAVAPAWSSSRIIRNDGTPTSPQSAFVDFMRDRIL